MNRTGNAQERAEHPSELRGGNAGGDRLHRPALKTVLFVLVLLTGIAVAGYTVLNGQCGLATGEPTGSDEVASSCKGCPLAHGQSGSPGRDPCLAAPSQMKPGGSPSSKAVIFLLLAGGDSEASNRASHVLDSVTAGLLAANRPVLSLTLREGDKGYDQMIEHFSVTSLPCVITLSQGCQSSVVKTPDIAENVLCRAFVKAIGDCGTDSTGQSSPACGATSLSSPQAPKGR